MIATINGISTYYELSGPSNGLPVVFIHGFPFSSSMWKPQVEALSSTYLTLVYDVRGHGSTVGGDFRYSIEYFVDDLFALLDHLSIGRAVICGLSMGGYIALRAIEREPARFRAAGLFDTRSEADSNEAKIKRVRQAQSVVADGAAAFAGGFVKAVFSAPTIASHRDIVSEIESVITKTKPEAIAGTLFALAARTDTSGVLPTIHVPILIMTGESDMITPPSSAQAMKERVSDAELYIIPGAAHMSNLENTNVFNAHLIAFLGKVSKAKS
jgi:pimeloyl-ACP methyl ester carboxylesterase